MKIHRRPTYRPALRTPTSPDAPAIIWKNP
jgi:hypothetical protein